jgi:hypothetical protein
MHLPVDLEKQNHPFYVTPEHAQVHREIMVISPSGDIDYDRETECVVKEVSEVSGLPIHTITGDFRRMPTRPYIRDIILIGKNEFGEPSLLVNYPHIFESEQGTYQFALQIELLSQQLSIPKSVIALFIEGGNVLRTRDYLLMGKDIIEVERCFALFARNDKQSIPVGYTGQPERIINIALNLNSQKAIIIDALGNINTPVVDGLQTINHIDLCLNVVLGKDGKEYFLLGDCYLAVELLNKSINEGTFNNFCKNNPDFSKLLDIILPQQNSYFGRNNLQKI